MRNNIGMTIPWEVADGITVANLQDQYSYLKEELRKYEEEGEWMHPEDAERSRLHYLPALKCIIEFYGGSVE